MKKCGRIEVVVVDVDVNVYVVIKLNMEFFLEEVMGEKLEEFEDDLIIDVVEEFSVLKIIVVGVGIE